LSFAGEARLAIYSAAARACMGAGICQDSFFSVNISFQIRVPWLSRGEDNADDKADRGHRSRVDEAGVDVAKEAHRVTPMTGSRPPKTPLPI